MNLKSKLSEYSLYELSSIEIQDIAYFLVREGFSSPSLFTVLSLNNKADSRYEFKMYFEYALRELNIQIPSRNESISNLLDEVLDDCIERKICDGFDMSRIFTLIDSKELIDQHDLSNLDSLYSDWWDLKEKLSYSSNADETGYLNQLKDIERSALIELLKRKNAK